MGSTKYQGKLRFFTKNTIGMDPLERGPPTWLQVVTKKKPETLTTCELSTYETVGRKSDTAKNSKSETVSTFSLRGASKVALTVRTTVLLHDDCYIELILSNRLSQYSAMLLQTVFFCAVSKILM